MANNPVQQWLDCDMTIGDSIQILKLYQSLVSKAIVEVLSDNQNSKWKND